jgi:hypothetical protein
MPDWAIVSLAIAMFSLGLIAGHGLGYWRARDVQRRRRVGRPE